MLGGFVGAGKILICDRRTRFRMALIAAPRRGVKVRFLFGRQLIELMRAIMNYDAEFRREEATSAVSSSVKHCRRFGSTGQRCHASARSPFFLFRFLLWSWLRGRRLACELWHPQMTPRPVHQGGGVELTPENKQPKSVGVRTICSAQRPRRYRERSRVQQFAGDSA